MVNTNVQGNIITITYLFKQIYISCCEFESHTWLCVLDTILCDKACR